MSIPLVVLVILDGWGLAPASPGNAISQANTANMRKFLTAYPHTQLAASGEAAGLPSGEAGNTEAGHLNLGAGRIVYQDLPRINMAISDGSFFKTEAFLQAIEHARERNSDLHLIGLVGGGTVHASRNHLYTLLRLCREQNFERVFVHVFTDGRDSPPTSALSYISELRRVMKEEEVGKIASLMGRYWAMDRDFRWERTAKAYFALTQGKGKHASKIEEAIEEWYEDGKTDEFIEPTLVVNQEGTPIGLIKKGDAVIFFNFRIDRPRQLTKAFVWADFENTAQKEWEFDPYAVKYFGKHEREIPKVKPFQRGPKIEDLFFVTMTEYGKPFRDKTHIAFPPVQVKLPLGGVLAQNHFRQLRIAESEKGFVTFFFNGQNETPFPGEEWAIVNSPKVSTYEQKPEMAAREITQLFLEKVGTNIPPPYRFVLINFANPDMLAHTGNKEALIRGLEAVDELLGKIVNRTLLLGGAVLITADHGNAEQIIDPRTGGIHTEHTANPVPFIIIEKSLMGKGFVMPAGTLADVAPTTLSLLGLDQPSLMTGRPLFEIEK